MKKFVLLLLLLIGLIGYHFLTERVCNHFWKAASIRKSSKRIKQPLPSDSWFENCPVKPLVVGRPWKNSLGIAFAWIPPGSFLMGRSPTASKYFLSSDEIPSRKVTVKHGFWMATNELSKDVLAKLLPHLKKNHLWERPIRDPSGAGISWRDSMNYCSKLTLIEEKIGILDGYVYSLPTEAQWEYCCRAGTKGDYYGSSMADVKANAFGLFQINNWGWEWCLDRWHENYVGAPSDERAWLSVTESNRLLRVLRGGAVPSLLQSSPASMRQKCDERNYCLTPRSWIRIILISKVVHAKLVDSTLLGFEE